MIEERRPCQAKGRFGSVSPQSGIAEPHILLHVQTVNATILVRIMPDLCSKYALLAEKEELGQVDTLTDAVRIRDLLKGCDLTTNQARAILQTVAAAPRVDASRD